MEPARHISISASEATRRNGDFAERSYHAYGHYTAACRTRLKRFIEEHPDQTFLVYSVPMVIVGAALRDARGIINHIVHSLKSDGFDAHYLGDNLIFIQWEKAAQRHTIEDHVGTALVGASTSASLGTLSHRTERARSNDVRPVVTVSDKDAYAQRLENEMKQRMITYERDARHPNAQRRKSFNNMMSHQDALHAAVTRTSL